MPLDPAYKAGLARHETGQNNSSIRRNDYEQKHGYQKVIKKGADQNYEGEKSCEES